jgi:hypothetical protein
MSNTSESWHLDKRVPITLIVAILVQSMAFVWAASQINFQVQDHERRITAAEMTDQRRERELYGFNDRLARLEEQSKAQLETLKRIEGLLRQQ